MCQNGCLFLLLEVLKLFASVDGAVGETVRIHGVLACGGAPVIGARLKLYDGDGLKDDGTTANYRDEFLFQVKDIEPSILYLTINHHCDGGIFRKQCIRKDQLLFQEITKKRLIYHIGMLELQHTNISHPKVLHSIQSHDGCKCYNQSLFQDDSVSCMKLIRMNQKKNSKMKQQKIIDEI
ncbi:Transthyretin-like protein [Dirofilaria immitis]